MFFNQRHCHHVYFYYCLPSNSDCYTLDRNNKKETATIRSTAIIASRTASCCFVGSLGSSRIIFACVILSPIIFYTSQKPNTSLLSICFFHTLLNLCCLARLCIFQSEQNITHSYIHMHSSSTHTVHT